MAIYRGFVQSLQVRDDGWAEFVVQAVHSGNATQTFFISDLDGDITTAHKRLAHLSLVRDAIARVLPVEVEFRFDERQGNLVEDLTIYPRPSFDGRFPSRTVTGTVIGILISERGPLSGASPYRDAADTAAITILKDSGSLEQVMLDLQRPDVMTAHAMLGLLREAYRTRRPVSVVVSAELRGREGVAGTRGGTFGGDFQGNMNDIDVSVAATDSGGMPPGGPLGYIQACQWVSVEDETLDYLYAFIERLGQRYESYDATEAPALSHVRVLYTTAPGQTPEGDVSDNGTFTPQTAEAWVHGDSPLLVRLEAALRDRLQVKLGLEGNKVHEVEMVGHLGSAARPIWIRIERSVLPLEETGAMCENQPTIQNPTASDFNEMPFSVSWRGHAYFNEGIWRFVIRAAGESQLLIDGESPCCSSSSKAGLEGNFALIASFEQERPGEQIRGRSNLCHVYLNGMHRVELILTGRTCSQPFQFQAYRIR
jgi:hypothetical protein